MKKIIFVLLLSNAPLHSMDNRFGAATNLNEMLAALHDYSEAVGEGMSQRESKHKLRLRELDRRIEKSESPAERLIHIKNQS